MREMERLYYIACVHGYGAAVDFAKKTLKQYENAYKDKKHFCHIKENDKRFKESIFIFKQVLAGVYQF